MSEPTTLVAFRVSDESTARTLHNTLHALDLQDSSVTIIDAALAVSDQRNQIQVTPIGASERSSTVGLLAGAMLAGAAGSPAGRLNRQAVAELNRRLRSAGFDDRKLLDQARQLTGDQVLLYILYTGHLSEPMLHTLRNYDAELTYSTLDPSAIAHLNATMHAHDAMADTVKIPRDFSEPEADPDETLPMRPAAVPGTAEGTMNRPGADAPPPVQTDATESIATRMGALATDYEVTQYRQTGAPETLGTRGPGHDAPAEDSAPSPSSEPAAHPETGLSSAGIATAGGLLADPHNAPRDVTAPDTVWALDNPAAPGSTTAEYTESERSGGPDDDDSHGDAFKRGGERGEVF